MPNVIYLFDIDMTLLDSDGAGREAMTLACRQLYGVEDALAGVAFAGRTDTYILETALRQHGIGEGGIEELLPAFIDAYCDHLETVLATGRGRLLPGVTDLLPELQRQAGAQLGLATGNFRRAALLKLGRFGLDLHFSEGGFGEDHIERAEVVAAAVRRLDGAIGPENRHPRSVVVIGDTPHDVLAGRTHGHVTVGVATGFHSEDELRNTGADLVLADLGNWEAVIEHLLRLAVSHE